jgi:hypothetical protein
MISGSPPHKSRRHGSLTNELAWVLAIKLIVLFCIWLAFFSQPVTQTSVDTHLQQTFSLTKAAPNP